MTNSTLHPSSVPKLFAGAAAAALLIGWTGVSAQAANPEPLTEQASLATNDTTSSLPSVPLGPENAREVQNQLIALGFDPGAADGQIGPATTAAAQQYDLSRGGNGRVSIDGAFLARLKADTAPRLTYDQVAARSQARQPVQTYQSHASSPAPASSASSGASQFGSVVSQIAPLIGAAIANSNNNRSYGYGPGYYGQGPAYYGPPPGYYGYGYGGF